MKVMFKGPVGGGGTVSAPGPRTREGTGTTGLRVAVIGTGYVGLVAGTCFAEAGNEVVCVDVDARKVAQLERGESPIYEPGLDELLRKNGAARRLRFTTDLADAVGAAEVVFIAVGTPQGENGDADLQYVLQAAESIGRALRRYTVVVDKSTVPVGTADRVREVIARVTTQPFDVVSNPEFLKEGAALADFLEPDRVVVGVASERARRVMERLYAPFVSDEHPLYVMDVRSAEMTKYAANAMLATRISFMNDIAALCEKLGADVEQVRVGMGSDRRIGMPFLQAGCGYGGSCFPKDVKALIATAREAGVEMDILRAVERTNARQKRLLLDKALRYFGGSVEGRTFAVWGLAFKPCTDDMREAPAIDLVEGLLGKGALVRVCDPVAEAVARRHFGDRVTYAGSCYEAAQGTDALFLVTDWPEYRSPDWARLREAMRAPVIFDGRNALDPQRAHAEGFTYFAVGRASGPC